MNVINVAWCIRRSIRRCHGRWNDWEPTTQSVHFLSTAVVPAYSFIPALPSTCYFHKIWEIALREIYRVSRRRSRHVVPRARSARGTTLRNHAPAANTDHQTQTSKRAFMGCHGWGTQRDRFRVAICWREVVVFKIEVNVIFI